MKPHLYNGERLIATTEQIDGLYYLVPTKDITSPYELPLWLFKMSTEPAPLTRFNEWLETRVFPPNRIGVEELLYQLGLDRYDPLLIAKETKAKQMTDKFWVDFK